MRRVAVLGMSGAGKSTLTARLAALLDAPAVHLDAIQWRPGWVPADPAEVLVRHAELVGHERWVIDGNYSQFGFADRLARAELVVVLLVPRRVALAGVVRRWLRYRGATRPDLVDGLPERLTLEFLRWVWRWPADHPGFLDAVTRAAGDARVVVLRSHAEADRLVEEVRRAGFEPALTGT